MDLILSQFNLDSPLPTFIEMRAQEDLMHIMRGGFRYGMAVASNYYPTFHHAHSVADEIFTVLWGLLDYRFLKAIDATFAESFYGIKRVLADGDWKEGKGMPLTRRERVLSVVFGVVVPYLHLKLNALITRLREEGTEGEARPGLLAKARRVAKRIFLLTYPWVNFAYITTECWYWLRYLSHWPWWNPWLHSRGIILRRMEASDYELQTRGPHARFLDYSRRTLAFLIAVFRVLEWWNSTESLRQATEEASTRKPPPPEPPQAVVDLSNLDEGACPICRHPTTNPTLNAASGYVYCYPCIHQHVEATRKDFVTHIPSSLDHLRRIYESGA
eukprot:Sspe_Gene.116375::Locus_105575_Transcript_1_1_Confidence_1.000_Length_1154::g.116375::m.116375/K13345/PEX12, PAF3; peroxin-12